METSSISRSNSLSRRRKKPTQRSFVQQIYFFLMNGFCAFECFSLYISASLKYFVGRIFIPSCSLFCLYSRVCLNVFKFIYILFDKIVNGFNNRITDLKKKKFAIEIMVFIFSNTQASCCTLQKCCEDGENS